MGGRPRPGGAPALPPGPRHPAKPWSTRERILVALSGDPGGDTLIRRAKRTASRGTGETTIEGSGDDIDIHVVTHSEAAHGHLLHRSHAAGQPPDTAL